MKLITALLAIFRPSNADVVMDHVPVPPAGNVAAKKLARARKEAAKRHGKTFHCHEIKPRETKPSLTLNALNQLSAPATVIIVPEGNVSLLRTGSR